MKIFNYFKNIKARRTENIPCENPKKDKVFIAIIAVFIVMIIFGIVSGGADGNGIRSLAGRLKFSVSDAVILAGIIIAYIIIRVKKGGRRF